MNESKDKQLSNSKLQAVTTKLNEANHICFRHFEAAGPGTELSAMKTADEDKVFPPVDKLFELSQTAERCDSSESIDELTLNIITILSQAENNLDSIANAFQDNHEELTIIPLK